MIFLLEILSSQIFHFDFSFTLKGLKKIRACLLILMHSMIPPVAQGQYYFYSQDRLESPVILEVGASIGAMNCLTDLGGKKGKGKPFLKDLNWKNSKLCGGIYFSALYQYAVGLRFEATWGQLTACDSILKNDNSVARARYERNLHFRTSITEFTLTGQLYPLSLLSENSTLLNAYLFAGIGYFSFNPEAQVNNTWVLLHQLCTEGQGFREYPDRTMYKLKQINFPVGLGISYEISALLNMRVEIMHRILKTDYLDDVSKEYIDPSLFYNYFDNHRAALAKKLAYRNSEINPLSVIKPGEGRGDPKDNDAYFNITFKFGIVLNRSRRQ